MMAFDSDTKLIKMAPLVIRFTATTKLVPTPRSLSGKILVLYPTGWVPSRSKNAVLDSGGHAQSNAPRWYLSGVVIYDREARREAHKRYNHTYPLIGSNGQRPILSTVNVATKTKINLTTPIAIVLNKR